MLYRQRFAQYIIEGLKKPDTLSKNGGIISLLLLISLLIFIGLWQCTLALDGRSGQKYEEFGIHHSCGVSFADPEHVFAYGLYYWGLFPVFPRRDLLPKEFAYNEEFYSREGSNKILNAFGYSLRMDMNGIFRMGHVFNLWLPYIVAIFKGGVEGVNFIPINGVYFTVALLFLVSFFWIYGKGLLGLIICLLIGSYPFQLYSVYYQDNIFSYMISTLILVTAFFTPFIFNKKTNMTERICLLGMSGIWLGIAFLMRTDCFSVFFPCCVIILLYKHANIRAKAGWLIYFFIMFYATVSLFHGFFDYKFNQAVRVVEEKGGVPFTGGRLKNHHFWHTIWCGMSDFDKKYGHSWEDYVAEMKAKPVLKEKYGIDVGPIKYHNRPTDNYLSPQYPDEYNNVMRYLVFEDLKKDPLWYIGILMSRFKKIFFSSIQPQINLGIGNRILLPTPKIFYFILPVILVIVRAWGYVRLLLISMGSAIIPICVTTYSNYNYYSIVHLFIAALLFYIIIKTVTLSVKNIVAKGG